MRPFHTIKQAADFLGCSVATIRRAVQSRRLAAHKPMGRAGMVLIKHEDLIAWLERSRVAAVGEDFMADHRKA